MKRAFSVSVFAMVFLFAGSLLLAQLGTQGSILGVVSDTTGAVVPGAEVVITNVETGQSVTTGSNEVGIFEVFALNRGFYDIKVSLAGFKTWSMERAELTVGQRLRVTPALEIGDVKRFGKIDQAISYCGLCSRLDESAGKSRRGPLSKQRNGHLQHVLIEVAKVAPRWNEELARLHTREVERGHRNRATLAPARQLVTLLLAVERRGTAYERRE